MKHCTNVRKQGHDIVGPIEFEGTVERFRVLKGHNQGDLI